jgi:small-conductance mechanosensitive channel
MPVFLNVLIILVLAWAALRVLRTGLHRLHDFMASHSRDGEQAKRADTLGRACRNIGSLVICVVAAMLILNQLGISIAPILATAGVAGIAIGFGAQSLVKDYFSGLFLLLEDQIRQGDVVKVAGIEGLVERVTLRYVRLRDFDGHVHFVPNGEIKVVTNRTRDYANAVIEAGVAFREDLDRALEIMQEVGREMRADKEWKWRILDDVEIAGVERFTDAAVVLRCRIKVVGIEQWNVRREFLRRLKMAFEAAGIAVPVAHLNVYAGHAPAAAH